MSFPGRYFRNRTVHFPRSMHESSNWTCSFCQRLRSAARFSTSTRARQDQRPDNGPFRTRLRTALRSTKVRWKPIPVGLGIGFLGAVQFYRVREREKARQQEQDDALESREGHPKEEQHTGRPKKRQRVRPSGPWWVEHGRSDGLSNESFLQADPSHVYPSSQGHVANLGTIQ